jgi:hypothetical protein
MKFFQSKGENSFKTVDMKKSFFNKRCFYCKRLGHMIKDYRTKLAVEANNNNNNQSNIVTKEHRLYVATLVAKEELNPIWYIHTMATQHMCFEKESFTHYKVCSNHQLVYLSDNSTHIIQGQGNVTITLINGIEKQILDIFYVLGLRKNMFSAKQFDKVGGETH